ncbi:CDP-alcohol phosphatidyltransferase family protein [Dongia deserti]|uniref:CDP-alcohol phosphatidyltransferase family protein n=1 Tax=Dongia deserti TaxID=2268030 RepID=UPI00254699DB|nr:CDP-alcohol phosphatidyltransferase family protein [Dongia deserti]
MSAERASIAFCLIGDSDLTLFSLSPRERLRRAFHRAGVEAELPAGELESGQGSAVAIRADYAFDEALIKAMINAPGVALKAENGEIVAAHGEGAENIRAAFALVAELDEAAAANFIMQDAATLASAYQKALRKRAEPVLLPLDGADAAAVERALFGSSYKGVTDVVTKYVWPVPALAATRWCARHGITPNVVTWVSFGFVLLATYLFWQAWFITGLLAAWAMCFLDTVDGKLARCTLTSTKVGDVFDHGIDLLHPPFWYYAWFLGLGPYLAPSLEWALWVVIFGYIAGRLQEGLFIWRFGIEIHTWRPVDSWFRLITARRNPNLLILTIAALLQAPDTGLVAVAWWMIASFIFHCIRIGQAFAAQLRGRAPVSWLQAHAGSSPT